MILSRLVWYSILVLLGAVGYAADKISLTAEQQSWLAKAKRFERAGWIYLHTEGEPRQRGFQHGYLLAKEIDDAFKVTRRIWEHSSAMDWKWLVETEKNETDIRASSVARRVRWKQLMKEHEGKIDVELAKRFEGDHFDHYRGKLWPGGRSLCGHTELDPDVLGQGHAVPYQAHGTVEGKVVDAAMAKKMSFVARFGSSCGMPFVAGKFLEAHPQFCCVTGQLNPGRFSRRVSKKQP